MEQPAPHRRGGRERQGRSGAGRRPRNAQRRDLSGQERPHRYPLASSWENKYRLYTILPSLSEANISLWLYSCHPTHAYGM